MFRCSFQLFLLSALFLVTCLPLRADSIGSIIEEALQSHPLITSRSYAYDSSQHEEREALAPYFPTVDIRGSSGGEYADNSSTRAVIGGSSSLWRTDGTLLASQLIFDGGDRKGTKTSSATA